MEHFKLSESFLEQFKGKQPKFGPLGRITYYRTYSRSLPNGKQEEFWQTIQRVVEGCYTIQRYHCFSRYRLPWNPQKAQYSAQAMYELMWNFKFLPPGRGLWSMGTDYIYERKTTMSLYNCSYVSTKDIATDFSGPFCYMMDALMMGVGVGGDTKGTGSLKLKEPKQGNYTFTVEDSREGWVELLRTILDGYSNGTLAPKEIDYSRVRLAGTPIKGFGGVSSGPDPLKLLIEDIHKLLSPVAKEEKPLTSTTIVDLFNFIGKCVVSGNIRRSAECMLSDPNDLAFLDLKDPKKFGSELKDRRWASNNSIYAQIGMDYSNVAERTAVNGEPGYLWIDNAREFGRMLDGPGDHDLGVDGANPCLEIMLESFELCNLTEVFPSRHSSLEELKKTLKFAYLYSKTVTLLPTHNERTNAVQLRNRRLGISMSGITQAFTRHGRRQFLAWCDSGYRYLRQIDRKYSRWLCIPESIKLTTTKPSGSVSLLPGVTPGIHYPHSEYYTRNIRFAKDSPMIDILKKSGYKIEPDTYSKQAVVVSVPVHEPHFDRCKDEVSMWEQLENVAQMQTYWADNAVSVTVTFNKNEAKDIKKALELYETRLKSVSFLPLENHGYEQAPYIQMDETAFNKMSDAIKPMRLSLEEGESVKDADDNYCEGDKCIVPLRK